MDKTAKADPALSMHLVTISSAAPLAEIILPRQTNYLNLSVFYKLTQIGRVLWLVRLDTLVLLVFIFSPTLLVSFPKSYSYSL